jgi:hypothetical protein
MRLPYFIFGSYVVGAIVVLAALVASAYLVTPTGSASVVHMPLHAAMLDIIRCSPPTHPNEWQRKTGLTPTSASLDLAREGLFHRADIYDPNDCGRVITQAMSPAIVPANPAHPG